MAEVIYQDPVQEIRGTLTKDGTIHRRKYYRDANGKIIGASKPEAYQILYPRNWKKNPAKGKELEHQLRFKDACAETKRILMAAKYLKAQATQSTNPALPSDYTPTPEDLASLQYWQDRFKPNSKSPNPKRPSIPTQAATRPISASMLSFELAFCERCHDLCLFLPKSHTIRRKICISQKKVVTLQPKVAKSNLSANLDR